MYCIQIRKTSVGEGRSKIILGSCFYSSKLPKIFYEPIDKLIQIRKGRG